LESEKKVVGTLAYRHGFPETIDQIGGGFNGVAINVDTAVCVNAYKSLIEEMKN
jgi:hypothetical protein